MMVQGKGITAKWGAGFCFRAVHQRGMAATGRDDRCGSNSEVQARGRDIRFAPGSGHGQPGREVRLVPISEVTALVRPRSRRWRARPVEW